MGDTPGSVGCGDHASQTRDYLSAVPANIRILMLDRKRAAAFLQSVAYIKTAAFLRDDTPEWRNVFNRNVAAATERLLGEYYDLASKSPKGLADFLEKQVKERNSARNIIEADSKRKIRIAQEDAKNWGRAAKVAIGVKFVADVVEIGLNFLFPEKEVAESLAMAIARSFNKKFAVTFVYDIGATLIKDWGEAGTANVIVETEHKDKEMLGRKAIKKIAGHLIEDGSQHIAESAHKKIREAVAKRAAAKLEFALARRLLRLPLRGTARNVATLEGALLALEAENLEQSAARAAASAALRSSLGIVKFLFLAKDLHDSADEFRKNWELTSD
jgi:hypothetical protein